MGAPTIGQQASELRDRLYSTMRRIGLVSRVIGPDEASGACADLAEDERYELAALLDEAADECSEIAEWLDARRETERA